METPEGMPQDPTPNILSTSAVLLHEVYTSLREAGFARREALYIISSIVLQKATPPSD